MHKLDQMNTQTVKTSDKVSAALKGMSNMLTAVGFSFSGFAATAVKSAMDWESAVDDLSDKTGLAAEEANNDV